MIIGYRAKGASISETAGFVKCSRAAVVKIYRDWTNGTVTTNRANCGAPRVIDVRGERRLRRFVRTNRRAIVDELTMQTNRGALRKIFTTTVQRILLRIGLRSRCLIKASRMD